MDGNKRHETGVDCLDLISKPVLCLDHLAAGPGSEDDDRTSTTAALCAPKLCTSEPGLVSRGGGPDELEQRRVPHNLRVLRGEDDAPTVELKGQRGKLRSREEVGRDWVAMEGVGCCCGSHGCDGRRAARVAGPNVIGVVNITEAFFAAGTLRWIAMNVV